MKKFLIRLLWSSALFYVGLYAVQYLYDYSISHSDDVNHKLWREVADGQVNADIVFIGSSRVSVHYDPNIFARELDYSSYILGLNSAGFDIQKVIRDLYLDNNEPPKILVQNVDITSFNKPSKYYKPPYLPYLSYKNVNTMRLVNNRAILDLAVPMFKYRYYVQNYQKLFKKKSPIKDRGYQTVDQTWEEFLASVENEPERPKVDISKFDYDKGLERIEEVILRTKELGTELYIVWAPEYFERFSREEPYLSMLLDNFNVLDDTYEHVTFLDFTKDSITLDRQYFYNDFHLNKKGVAVYNAKVVDSIRLFQNLKKK